jgi:hypothetical protein
MSVNIFGSSSRTYQKEKSLKSQSTGNTVDNSEQFVNIQRILASKFSNYGGTITGNIAIELKDDIFRAISVLDLSAGKTFRINFGDQSYIENKFGYDLKMESQRGILIQTPYGKVCRFGSLLSSLTHFYGEIDMNRNVIRNVKTPELGSDVATKSYVDNKVSSESGGPPNALRGNVKSNVAFIPSILNSINKGLFTLTTSGDNGISRPSNIFNYNPGAEWASATLADGLEPYLQIQCPFPVAIHKFGIRSKRGQLDHILSWSLTASTNGQDFVNLYQSEVELENTSLQFFNVDHTIGSFSYFRITIKTYTGSNPGLAYFNMYTVDPVF